jgi:hypothetical protein
MPEKLVYKVSSIGMENANYLDLTEIAAGTLETEDTVLLYPGSYTDPGANATRFQNVSIVGVGRRDNIVINGFTVPASFTGEINFKNVSFASPGVSIGNTTATVRFFDCLFAGANSLNRSASLAAGNACITKGVAGATFPVISNSTLVVEDSEFSPGTAYSIVAHDYGTITIRECLMRTDAGVLSNGACTFESVILTGANNIVSTVASPIAVPAHTYRASVAATSNAGNCTKTAVAVLT